ncbi:MAG: outer membrane beta-barrel domain-containing protein [Deltaproteobacteria bacterium]|nr:outer membrane beta-barrel domain-containing protein [Deltaproteobacteria bacterium]MCW5804483.1 outer membrane beta-barrel domain-containing protein [Deltaproteobacteria bacterium]
MNKTLAALAFGAVFATLVPEASADRRVNGLSTDKAVRHRRLLVSKRFELSPLFESTINADFRHIVGGGAKLEYHFSDMFSFGFIGVGSTAINTGLVDKITPTLLSQSEKKALEGMGMMIREPSKEEFEQRLNSMPFHGAAYVSLTPWYGKLAAFSQAFVAFDFYFQGGISIATLESNCDKVNVCNDPSPGKPRNVGGMIMPPDLNPNNDDPVNNGTKIGLYIGGGIHVFVNDFIALDFSIRDYAFSDNPSGADVSGPNKGPDQAVDSQDSRLIHHLFFGAGVSIMFPTRVKRTP